MTTQTLETVSCPGCSQTYRIPRATKKASAPCKKCGATIDLGRRRPSGAGRRPASAAPAAAPAPAADPAVAAVRGRSSRAQRALGARNKQPLSPVHVVTGVLALGAVVVAVVMGLS